jgi:hypothetical protein
MTDYRDQQKKSNEDYYSRIVLWGVLIVGTAGLFLYGLVKYVLKAI